MDDEDISHPYDNSHRAFLQAFMARGTMTFSQAQPILAAIFTVHDQDEYKNGNSDEEPEVTRPEQVTREDFESYVSAVSAAISPFDMEIRSTTHQVSKERVYSLINTTSDPMTQLATLRSAEEMAFVRRVIDAMFDRYNSPRMEVLCLDGMQANKLRTAPRNEDEENGNGNGGNGAGENAGGGGGLKGLKSSEVEQVLRGLVDEGWFERSRAGFYSLSARALTELRQWLVDAYNDAEAGEGEWQRVKFCEACREIVTVGQRCAERDCCVRLHDICQEAFWRTRKERACPRCGTGWTGRNFVGEKAVTETEAYQRGRRRSGRGGGRSSLMEDIVDGEEEEE
ncbi:Nse1 non-SMC component of SMC5-6 complex-domain-containing protein [Daldinia vernicosa]|uniref:Nse1 non-SMC component of SMC5-6 complex-domain-containing protein n=1 Tax=Daldinia vernicosa TaxID=114800 RepID=UPI0020078F73|nr:Nse1 non-SMC component of SMC5-6 complex-domain-containing protein [Daldinia vernicosa]KAI0850517.1 Nse1 non-SMC component of SMC5-6 complex-domain-containing protein [Daldinia vernicosa]